MAKTKLKKEYVADLKKATAENLELKDALALAQSLMKKSDDNFVTKLLVFFAGDLGRSKRFRAILMAAVTAGLGIVSMSVSWVDPAWSSAIVGILIAVIGVFVKKQSDLDIITDGKTSANGPAK